MKWWPWLLALVSTAALAVPPANPPSAAKPPPAAKPAAKVAPAPAAPMPTIQELGSVAGIKDLCLATRPVDRVFFAGDEVAKAQAKEQFVAVREDAMGQLYHARIPASGFALGEYRSKAGQLSLDLSRAPRALHGALILAIPGDIEVLFDLNTDQARAVNDATTAGDAVLDTYFELEDETGAVCSGSAASEVFAVNVRPVAFVVRDRNGNELAREETPLADKHRNLLGGYSGIPTVILGGVETEGADALAISKRISASLDDFRQCYAERLKVRPDASGAMWLGIAVQGDGHIDTVTFIADAVGDEPLRKCIEKQLKSIRFVGVAGLPTLCRAPLDFKLAPK